MRQAWNPFQRVGCRLAAVAAIGLGLGGCFDIGQRLTFQPDGTANIAVVLSFDKEVEDIAALLEAYTKFSTEADKFQQGVCAAAQKFAEANPPPNKNITLKSEQSSSGDRFICLFTVNLAKASELEHTDPIFQIKQVGERRFRISVDLANIPDFSKDAQSELLAALRDKLPADKFVQLPDAELAGMWGKHVAAAVALTRIFLRDHSAEFTVAAPRIVETNGTVAPDGASVSLKLSFVELVKLALDREARGGKIYYVVVEY
jgi:hypothetical protein